MKKTIISASTLGISGLVTAGLLALPVAGATSADAGLKRDEGTTELTLVADDDNDDDNDDNDDNDASRVREGRGGAAKAAAVQRADTRDTRTRDRNTRSRGTRADDTRGDNSRTGSRSGRDKSRAGKVKDWTTDGPGAKKRDWSSNKTNDRSRNNTR